VTAGETTEVTADTPLSSDLEAVIARVDPPSDPAATGDPTLGRFGRFLARWDDLGGGTRPSHPVLVHGPGDAPGVSHGLRTECLPAARSDAHSDAFTSTTTLVDRLVDAGVDALVLCDPAATAMSTRAAIGLLTQSDAVAVTGPDADDARWMLEAGAIRDAMRYARPHRGEPLTMLRALDAEQIGVTAVALVSAAARRVPVLLDGTTSLAAALVAMRLAYRGRGWWCASHRPDDPAATAALTRLDLDPLVDLGLRRGGVGAPLVMRILTP